MIDSISRKELRAYLKDMELLRTQIGTRADESFKAAFEAARTQARAWAVEYAKEHTNA